VNGIVVTIEYSGPSTCYSQGGSGARDRKNMVLLMNNKFVQVELLKDKDLPWVTQLI
jgi:hypothetical protein